MSAIPKDIAAKADAVYDALGRGSLADTGAIARAILSERERCAKIAKDVAERERGERASTAEHVAQSIRGQL